MTASTSRETDYSDIQMFLVCGPCRKLWFTVLRVEYETYGQTREATPQEAKAVAPGGVEEAAGYVMALEAASSGPSDGKPWEWVLPEVSVPTGRK